MQPTQSLPPGYIEVGTLDLSKNLSAMVILNLIGVLLMILSGWLFLALGLWLRPQAAQILKLEFSSAGGALMIVLALLGIMAVMLVVHEAIHGLFFWFFTRSRPRFGIGWGYAYTTAPGWYLPRGQYFVVGLAPLVLISLGGMALAAVAPLGLFVPLLALVVMNASGAVGDLAVAAWLLTQPSTCLAQDKGDAVTLYRPG